jgi:hypothetical protein
VKDWSARKDAPPVVVKADPPALILTSAGVAGVEDWAKHLRIAADGPGFVGAIEETLVNDTPDAARQRVEAVRRETWELRVRLMLEPLLAKGPREL